ncbi:MAG: M28 family peptidase, partial [Thermoprotei archaeon]
VGGGDEHEYLGKNLEDAFVLAELSYTPPRPEKAFIAKAKGAKGLIIMNWGDKDNKIIGRGAIKWIWGLPTPEDIDKIPRIVSINISRADGEYLKKLLENHKSIKAKISVEVKNTWVTANQPMCKIYSSKSNSKELIIVGGHLEAWGGTVTDNSSGNAIMLEIARMLSENRAHLIRNVIMGFWDGHEIGEAAGSSWFVDNYWSEINNYGVAYINIDACGIKGASRFISYSSPETWKFLEEIEKEVLGKISEKKLPLKIGDNSFLGVGIPYVFTFATYTESELEKLGGALFGWWYHSDEDTLDKVDKNLLEVHAQLYLGYILKLATEPVIPLDFEPYIDVLISETIEINTIFSKVLDTSFLNELLNKIKFLKIRINEFNKLIINIKERYQIDTINKTLLNLSRILTPAFRSTVDRYSHDPYGYRPLTKPLPRIYQILDKMSKIKIDTQEYYTLTIKLRKQLNILHDALDNAITLTDSTLNLIS